MKRPLLIAALLATASLIAVEAKADTATINQMFNIKTPAAGTVDFSGEGTANFNQSLGTNNSFNVGSSTNLGVNASASSTSDYAATGNASLKLDGSSRLQQTIGTASAAFNAATAAESSSFAAATSAIEVANTHTHGSSINAEWAADYSDKGSNEWHTQEEIDASIQADGNAKYASGSVEGYYAAQDGGSFSYDASATESATVAFEDQWQDKYNETYTTSYGTAVSASNTANSSTDATGIIKGNFTTTTSGSAESGMGSLSSSFENSASSDATVAVGAARGEFSSLSSTKQSSSYGWDGPTNDDGNGNAISGFDAAQESTWSDSDKADYAVAVAMFQSDWDSAYQGSYAESYSDANAKLQRTSTSDVTVTGIGVIADINADSASQFSATSALMTEGSGDTPVTRNGNGNGNASAGANLSTSSYANQSSSDTANAFMQAFSATQAGSN